MAYRLVQGDLLIRKMLADSMAAISVMQSISAERQVGAVGHSLGGMLALFLAALDMRIAFTWSSGAVGSYQHKLAHGTPLEMSLIIPGFAKQFDIDDLVRCIAPRRLFVVSSPDDPFSTDADEIVRRAGATFEEMSCRDRLEHMRGRGGHELDKNRFDSIVSWIVAQCQNAG
jgi:hypothetical protein